MNKYNTVVPTGFASKRLWTSNISGCLLALHLQPAADRTAGTGVQYVQSMMPKCIMVKIGEKLKKPKLCKKHVN